MPDTNVPPEQAIPPATRTATEPPPPDCMVPRLAGRPGQRQSCARCAAVFDKDWMPLADLQLGGKDKLGYRVVEVYGRTDEYAVYRSTHGVHVHFADCREREREQRANLMPIQTRLCRLRYLSGQMLWDMLLQGGQGGFYDHEIAEAIALAIQRRQGDADGILATGEAQATDRLESENRIAYFLACLVSTVLFIGVLLAFGLGAEGGDRVWRAYAAAAAFGAVGATFSIGARVNDLSLKPCQQSILNYAMGVLRVLIGATAGSLILLICTGSVIGEPVVKVLEKFSGELSTLGALSGTTWMWIGLLGLLGGFAERLVPDLLGTAVSKATPQPAPKPV